MKLLDHFGITPRQLMPNLWRIVISCIGIWLATTNGGMLKVDELVYLYRLKESKEHGTMNWCPSNGRLGSSRVYLHLLDIGSPDFSLCLGTILRLPLEGFGVISRDCIVSGEPRP